MQENVQTMKKRISRVRGSKNGLERCGRGVAFPKNWQGLKRGRRHLVRDGVCSSLQKMVKATNTSATGLSLENRYGGMLLELLIEEEMQSLAESVKECVLVLGM